MAEYGEEIGEKGGKIIGKTRSIIRRNNGNLPDIVGNLPDSRAGKSAGFQGKWGIGVKRDGKTRRLEE